MVQKVLGHESVHTTFRYYVHTGDGELAGATENLRGRKVERGGPKGENAEPFRIIPFPKREVS